MGCDIHMVVQTFNRQVWVPAPVHGYGERNYYLFSALAGVRNHDGVKPISAPRGLPEMAMAPETEDSGDGYTADLFLCDRWWDGSTYDNAKAADETRASRWLGNHSRSHLTLAEILSWPGWTTPVQREGIVSFDEFCAWKDSGKPGPASWSRGVSGGRVSIFLPSDVPMMRGLCERFPNLYAGRTEYTVAYWTDPCLDAGEPWRAFVDALKAHAVSAGLTHDQIRIVFGFDS